MYWKVKFKKKNPLVNHCLQNILVNVHSKVCLVCLLLEQQPLSLQILITFSFPATLAGSFDGSGLESTNYGCWKYALCHEESLKNSILVRSGNWGKGNSCCGEI